MGALISAKRHLRLEHVHPGLPPIDSLRRAMLELYLSSWTSANKKGILTIHDKITSDGSSESWPVFCIELTGILIKYGFRELLSFALQDASALTELL